MTAPDDIGDRLDRIAGAVERIAAALEPVAAALTVPIPEEIPLPCPRCKGLEPVRSACELCAGAGVATAEAVAEWTGRPAQ